MLLFKPKTCTKQFPEHLFVAGFALFGEKVSIIAVTEFHSGIKLFLIFFLNALS